jgi:hypothetical protein
MTTMTLRAQWTHAGPIVAAGRQLRADHIALAVLAALVALDLLFIGIHTWRGIVKEGGADPGVFADPRFSLLRDRGYAEIFDYLKFACVAAVLARLWQQHRQPIYLALALVFLAALADDLFQIHELGGRWLLVEVGRDTPLGIHVRDVGEIATWALLGAVAVAGLRLAWLASRPADNRVGLLFIGCLVLLALFGIGVDLLHALAPSRRLDGLFGIVEDGGEMLVLSLAVALAVFVARVGGPPPRRPTA